MDTVRKAVSNALRKSGTDLLENNKRFLEAVCATVGEETAEAKLLRVGCDDTFLKTFSVAAEEGTREALEESSNKAAKYLQDRYVLNPEVAVRVSSGIAEGCGDALGIELQQAERGNQAEAEKRGPKDAQLKTVLAICSIIALALAATLAYAHFEPIFGSTLFPTRATISGVDFERYVIKTASGEKESVFFVDNYGIDRLLLTPRSGIKAHTIAPKLLRDNQGVIFADANAEADDLVMQGFDSRQVVPTELSWAIKDDGGTKLLIITSEERYDISLPSRGSLVLVVRGPFLKTCAIPTGDKSVDYGVTSFTLESQDGYRGPSPLDLASNPDCELFFLGRKIPRSSS